MAPAHRCPQCGSELAADVPEGLCPECLLKQGMGAAASSEKAAQPTRAFSPVAGFVPPEPEELAPHFPQLEILELLGHGGMGAVYKARQKGLDRLVALKIIKPGAAEDPAFAERFAREARALARLGHPNIVAVHDFGRAGPLYYLVMEYVDGLTLRQMIRAGQLKPEEALAIVPQICDALQYAHDEGVVHRDIKPENILMDKRGRVKIADFGLAKLLGPAAADVTLTQARQVMGTPHYMAPEQVERPLEVDHRVDIYSLGVVFYEMLTGELPIGRFARPSQKVRVDVRLDEVVLHALEKEPGRRYQQVREVKTDVTAIAAAPPPPKPAEEPFERDFPEVDLDSARAAVAAPAIGLLITGILGLLPLLLIIVAVVLAALIWWLRNEPGPSPPGFAVVCSLLPEGGMLGWSGGGELAPPVFALAARAPGFGVGFAEFCIIAGGMLFYVPIAVIIIFGALKMRKVESYGLAVAAAILAMLPCSHFWFLGLPMGIWALVVLSRRDVKAAFGRVAQMRGHPHGHWADHPHPKAAPAKPGGPRICKLPVIGALWIPFGPLALAAFVVVFTPVQSGPVYSESGPLPLEGHAMPAPTERRDSNHWHPSRPERPRPPTPPEMPEPPRGERVTSPVETEPDVRPQSEPRTSRRSASAAEEFRTDTRPERGSPSPLINLFWIPAILIGLLGVTSPFGSTTLGCLGISRIRSSRGRLIGMPLAVGVALFYPLVILDAVLFFGTIFFFWGDDLFVRPGAPSDLVKAGVVMLVLGILFLDFSIVRAVWRAATRPTSISEPV